MRPRNSSLRAEPIALADLEGVYALLDQLHVGFALVDPDLGIQHTSFSGRGLLRAAHPTGTAADLLVGEVRDEVVAPVLAGKSSGSRWREISFPARPTAGPTHLSIRSAAVRFPDGRIGALLAFSDVSAEVSVHRNYRDLLARQKDINEQLRRDIAAVLREHEDDVAQFNEILSVAPTIFAAFMGEATRALADTTQLARDGGGAEAIADVLRAVHTLKGNARSLGLNFIGGRAHAVEELLSRARARGGLAPAAGGDAAILELTVDLSRALERARALRRRLGDRPLELSADAHADNLRLLDEISVNMSRALELLPQDHPARAPLLDASSAFANLTGMPLEHLFEYVKATAHRVAESESREPPLVEVSGGGIAVPPAVYHALSQALPHLVRNAVCHGIETPEERRSAGKSVAGRISLVARQERDVLRLWLRDDGRGLDRDELQKRARTLGYVSAPSLGDEEFDALLFRQGVSTAKTTTLDQGRGIGADAARNAIEAVGGTIAVWSRPGRGVEFAIAIPTVGPSAPAPVSASV